MLHHLRGAFRRLALHRLALGDYGLRLHLSEGPEKHVRKGAVHGTAHNNRQDQTGGPVEGSGRDQELVIQNEPHRHGGQARIRIQERDHCGHVRSADRDHKQDPEGQRQNDDYWEEECQRHGLND